MEMEFMDLLKVLWRWLWLIVLLVAVTCGLLYWNARNSIVGYSSHVIVLLSTPDREDVSALGEYTFTSDRDEITIAINKFVEIAQYTEVTRRTLTALNIDTEYSVEVDAELGADFIHITVIANSAELSAQIANMHAAQAIQFFGELRAMPSSQAAVYFSAEILTANEALTAAETALSNFQSSNNLVLLDRELELQYDILAQLEASRAELLIFASTGIPSRNMSNGGADTQAIVISQTDLDNLDGLILTQRGILANLASLEPEYNRLQEAVERQTGRYNALSAQLSNVEMRQSFSSQAMFIQVIHPARVPDAPEDTLIKTLSLGAMGSLGLGILLAFLLDYFFNRGNR